MFSEKLIKLWDYSDDVVLGVKTQREEFSNKQRREWLAHSKLDPLAGSNCKPQFARFTSKKNQEKRIEKLLDGKAPFGIYWRKCRVNLTLIS